MKVTGVRVEYSKRLNDGDYGHEQATVQYVVDLDEGEDADAVASKFLSRGRADVVAQLGESENYRIRGVLAEPVVRKSPDFFAEGGVRAVGSGGQDRCRRCGSFMYFGGEEDLCLACQGVDEDMEEPAEADGGIERVELTVAADADAGEAADAVVVVGGGVSEEIPD